MPDYDEIISFSLAIKVDDQFSVAIKIDETFSLAIQQTVDLTQEL